MSLLIFTMQKHRIIAEKATTNYALLLKRNKLRDLQAYSASIAEGIPTLNQLMTAPASMFGRMSIFAQYANQKATVGAYENYNYMDSIGSFNNMRKQQEGQTTEQAQAIAQQTQQMALNYLYKQEIEKATAREQKLLDSQDKKIAQEIAQLETKLQMLTAEEEKVCKAEEEGAKKSAPEYMA